MPCGAEAASAEVAGTYRIVVVVVAVGIGTDTAERIVAGVADHSDMCKSRLVAMVAVGLADFADVAVVGMRNLAEWGTAETKRALSDSPYWRWNEDDSPDVDSRDYMSGLAMWMRLGNSSQRANAQAVRYCGSYGQLLPYAIAVVPAADVAENDQTGSSILP